MRDVIAAKERPYDKAKVVLQAMLDCRLDNQFVALSHLMNRGE